MFIFCTLASSAGFLSAMQCGMCSIKITNSKENVSKMFDTLDFSKECKELMPKSASMCKQVTAPLFRAFLDMAPSRTLCHIINMCDINMTSLKQKETKKVTKDTMAKTKYSSQCKLATDLSDYLLGNGLEEYTIPYIFNTVNDHINDDPSLTTYLKKMNKKLIKEFVFALGSNYTSYDFASKTGFCKEL